METIRSTTQEIFRNERVMSVRARLPELNFITLHYLYFIGVCLIASVIFYGSSKPDYSISYTDSLYLVISAMTEAGLNTVNLSTMTTFQQVILWLLIIVGSAIWVSIFTVLTRKRYFETRFQDIVKKQKESRKMHRRSMSEVRERPTSGYEAKKVVDPTVGSGFEGRHSEPGVPTAMPSSTAPMAEKSSEPAAGGLKEESENSTLVGGHGLNDVVTRDGARTDADHISFMRYASPSRDGQQHARVLSFAGVGAHPYSTSFKFPPAEGVRSRRPVTGNNQDEGEEIHHWQYPHYLTRHNTGRNAQFHGLSKAEREHLGGVEYRAITLLAYVVPLYFVLWQLLGCLGLGAYIAHNQASTAYENGINPWWLGIFNGVSAFNNSGMSLLDANMIPFQTSVYTLITMGLLIVAGNTAYPLFLRLILWTMLELLCLICPSDTMYSDHKATLRFVLQYPRRVYTNLFPSVPTWWLLFMLIVLNGIDWAAFEIINIGNKAVSLIPTHFRVLDGLFQALAVRSGGFYVISITSLRIGLQVLYVIMMYISVYPVVITMRHSNVYEERSLGIYADDDSSHDVEEGPKLGSLATKFRRTLNRQFTMPFPSSTPHTKDAAAQQFVRQQIRGQLAHDLWWLVLAILFISIIEVSNFDRDPVTYSVFNIAFEVVSGYGCVGISTGLPNEAYSFSGGWHVLSKLILCAVMLRGRHRGLPVALDRAVRLPGQGGGELGNTEEEDRVVRSRSRSMGFQGRQE
ncbi:Low-affinity potassium transport [Hyphodiscus hymeniophilus]|uniref:Potassium transport protein n=1 Tax=Hyphodiscus hymeniophilus TaxID=353542 RepID=A0A9P6SKN9_9HELO|nr:Low-affinity potassium transport [Hyphodiscus hymeniophilus]